MPWFKFFQDTGRSEEEEKRIFERLMRNIDPEKYFPSSEFEEEPPVKKELYHAILEQGVEKNISSVLASMVAIQEMEEKFFQSIITEDITRNPQEVYQNCQIVIKASDHIINMLDRFKRDVLQFLKITPEDAKIIRDHLLSIIENASRILKRIRTNDPEEINRHIDEIASSASKIAGAIQSINLVMEWRSRARTSTYNTPNPRYHLYYYPGHTNLDEIRLPHKEHRQHENTQQKEKQVLPQSTSETQEMLHHFDLLVSSLKETNDTLRSNKITELVIERPQELYQLCHQIASAGIQITRFIHHNPAAEEVLAHLGFRQGCIQALLDELFVTINAASNICVDIKTADQTENKINMDHTSKLISNVLHLLRQLRRVMRLLQYHNQSNK